MDMVTIVGIIMMLIIVVLLTSNKVYLTVPFTLVPLIAAFCLGYSPTEVVDLIKSSLQSTMSGTVLMIVFSMVFFRVLAEAGFFDFFVYQIVRFTKGSATAIYLATVVICAVVGITASPSTIYIVPIPAMLALYDRYGLDRKILVFLCAMMMAVVSPLPWSSVTLLMETALECDPFEGMYASIPISIVLFIATILCCFYFGKKDKKVAAGGTEEMALEDPRRSSNPMYRMKLLWVNLALFVGCLVMIVCVRSIASWATFMVFLALAMLINYPNPNDARKVYDVTAPAIFNYVAIVLPIQVLIGVLNNTGMVTKFVQLIISAFPGSLAKYTGVILVLLMPIVFRFVPYQLYIAMLPFIAGIGAEFGISPAQVLALFLGTHWVSKMSSPCVAQTYLGQNLAGIDLQDFIKWTTPLMFIINTAAVIVGLVLGTFGI